MVKKEKKLRINFKALIILLLIIYLIVMLFYTIFNMKIKNIYILNTKLIPDNEIIEAAKIKDYPPIFKLNTKKLESAIKKIDLVNDVTISKNLQGVLTIDIEEAKPLFYNRNNDLVVLSNKKEVLPSDLYLGIPTLTNYVPTDIYEAFITALNEIDSDIIKMIDKIEYNPDISEDVVIDANRFLLTMNDGNLVYINTLNIKRLNNYIKIYASISESLNNQKGTLYLDSYLSENNLFTPF